MRIKPLTRLRLSFLALTLVLLTPLALLFQAVNQRIEAQRRLRHEVVAERIFDELERELTALIDRESARPSSAYDEATRVEAWAPFVVGYFKSGPDGRELLASAQLDTARAQRLNAALDTWTTEHMVSGAIQAPLSRATQSPKAPLFAPRSSPDVLRKLNRSLDERFLEESSEFADPMR